MSDRPMRWIVSYDIRCAKRLVRVGRFMTRNAYRLQYSVFIGKWTRRDLKFIIQALEELIDPRVDDVRCYPVEEDPWHAVLGDQRWSDGWTVLVNDGHVSPFVGGEPESSISLLQQLEDEEENAGERSDQQP